MNVATDRAGTHDSRGNEFTVWQMRKGTRQQLLAILESMGCDLVLFRDQTLQMKGGYRARFTAYIGAECVSGQLSGIEVRHFKDKYRDGMRPPAIENEPPSKLIEAPMRSVFGRTGA